MKKVLYFKSIFTFLITLLCHVGFGQEQLEIFKETFGTGTTTNGSNLNSYTGYTNGVSGILIEGTGRVLNSSQSSYVNASGGSNVLFSSQNSYMMISGIDTSIFSDIELSFGQLKGSSAVANSSTFKVEISTDGQTWNLLDYTNSGTQSWRMILFNSDIPSTQNLRIKFTNLTLQQWRLDDIKLVGTPVPQTAPILTTPQTIPGTYGVLINKTITGEHITPSTNWFITGTKPTGVDFANGVFNGSPNEIGLFTSSVKAKNGNLESNEVTVNFDISKADQKFPENIPSEGIQGVIDGEIDLPSHTLHASTNVTANQINYTSSNPLAVSVVGHKLYFVGVGTATITATSSNDNSNYIDINDSKSFNVTITLPPINTATIPHAENFNNNLGVWKNYKISGLNDFYGWYKSSSDNGATVDGSYSENTPAKSYLISPKFVSVQLVPISIGFNYKSNKENKKIKILYSTNYSGYGNPDNSTWNLIEDIENNSLINQNILKVIELCNLPSEFHIAFLYEEAIPETRWSISDLEIKYHLSKPNSLEADIIDDNSFNANWENVSSECNINQYELDVYKKVPQQNIILNENFDWANGTGGNDGLWSGIQYSFSIGNNLNNWLVTTVNAANKSLRLGSGSNKGSLKTPVLSGLNGNATLTFRAGAWNGSSEQTELVLNIEGGGTLSQSSVNMVKGAFTSYTVNIINGTPTTRISFEGKNASNSRFFLDDIKISQEIFTKHPIPNSPFPVDQANSKEITGVNLEENTYYYVVRSVVGDLQSEDSNEIKVYNRTTWDGTNWDNEEPNINIHAVVKGGLIIGQASDINNLTARSLKLHDSHAILVETGSFIKLKDQLINLSQDPIEFEEGSYLLQDDDESVNFGNATFKRNATFFGYDSKFWSSPVAGQKIKKSNANDGTGFYYNPSAIYKYNEEGRNWLRVSEDNFEPAQGYIIQVGSNIPFNQNGNPETPFTGSFTGVPNNGEFTIIATKSTNGLGDNGVGNPYGSPLSMEEFMLSNNTVKTLYFWNEDAHYIPGSNPAIYEGQTWFSYNFTGSNHDSKDHIGVGVGFIARVTEGSNLVFNNSMRDVVDLEDIQNRNQVQKDRFWLSLNSDNKKENQILIGYVEGATNGIDEKYDAKNISNRNSFILSHSNANAMIIEGRQYPLDVNDQIPLYFRASKLGEYTIKLENKEGVFNSQPIYLIDNELNLSINLNEITEYTFDSELGNFLTRFEIRYQPKESLSITDIDETSDLIVYKNENLNKVSSKENVVDYKVYDLSGQLIGNEKVNQLKDFTLTTQKKGTYIVKFTLENGLIINKKVIF